MKTLVRSLLCLTVFAVLAAPSVAATLTYTQEGGTAVLDPTDGGANPSAKVTGYTMLSNGAFNVDATRTAAFGNAFFFTNTASEISETDLTLAGTSNLINFKKLFTNNATSLADLQSKLTLTQTTGAPGTPETAMTLVFVPIPEPATAGLAGLCLVGLAAFRRRSA